MSIQHKYSFTPTAASTTGFASNVTAGTWTLTATSVGDGIAHKVTLKGDAATNHSAKTADLVGTDADDRAQTETINMPNGTATVTSTKYFKTLTSITPSATIGADTMDVGWSDAIASQTICLNHHNQVGALFAVDIGGTINYTVQISPNRREDYLNGQEDLFWIATSTSALAGATADKAGVVEAEAAFARFVTASFSSGATAVVYVSEAANER